MRIYKDHLILSGSKVKQALLLLNELSQDAILFVVDSDDKLIGAITDGDVRRGLIKGFTIDNYIDEIIQEALEMIGGEETLGHEPKSARRSINLILQDWQNRGVMLWTANTSVVTLATSVTTFSLGSATIDVLEAVANRDGTDVQLERISMQEYLKIQLKDKQEDQLNML